MSLPRAVEIQKYGGPEVLRLVEKPRRELGPGDVRIEVRAAGVNFADLMMRMGSYPEAPPKPFVPGYEVSGVVSETGKAVSRLKPGDRVVAATRFGGYTTEIVLPEEQIWKTPTKLSDIEAAAVPVNFMTAWIALQDMARVRSGDRVLIQSAAGGVGTAAVQIASRAGAHVVGLVGSPAKAEAVRALGAREVLLEADWEKLSDRDSAGFDAVLDSTGGKGLKRSFRRLRPGGRVVSFGASSIVTGLRRSPVAGIRFLAQTPFFHPMRLMMENKGVFGLNLLQLFDPGKRHLLANALESSLQELDRGNLRVIVGKTFPLSESGAAHSFLQSRASIGKVILDCTLVSR